MANPLANPPIAGPAARQALADLWDRVSSVGALVDDVTIPVDISRVVRVFSVTLGGNRTITFTGNGVALGDASLADLDGKQLLVRVKQDATGTRTLTLGTGARLGTDITTVTLTTTANKTDYIGLIYNHAAGKCDVIAFVKGF